MATVRRSGPNWQGVIRRKGHPTISKNFPREENAHAWAREMDARAVVAVERQKRFLGIDTDLIVPQREWEPVLWRRLRRNGRERSKSRGLAFNLTRDAFDAIAGRCGNRCEVTGIPFNRWAPTMGPGRAKYPFYPSIDRIDSREGYVEGNVRIVCHIVNLAMSHWGKEALTALLDGANTYSDYLERQPS